MICGLFITFHEFPDFEALLAALGLACIEAIAEGVLLAAIFGGITT